MTKVLSAFLTSFTHNFTSSISLELKCTTWSKNSFGLFNYHNASTENDMVRTQIFITGRDTKLLRHEKHVEIDHAPLRSRSKPRKIVVQVTAQEADINTVKDTETMDLSKKDQETSQILRVAYQKGTKQDKTSEGYWLYHKNKVNLQSIYTNPEEKLWYVVSKYPKEAYKTKGLKLEKNSIIRMGRIRLRVRDIDYPEPKTMEKVAADVRSQRSGSPKSQKSRQAKTNVSSNRKHSDSMVDDEFENFNRAMGFVGEGVVGEDGGIELQQPDLHLNKIDVQTVKHHKAQSAKKYLLANKSEEHGDDYKTERNAGKKTMKGNSFSGSQVSQESTKSAMVCRICLDYDNGVEDYADDKFNPMISPCNCSGTMGGIHLKCLRQWLEQNKNMKPVKGHVVLKYKKINCELCKQKFPFSVNINNRIVDVIEVEKPQDNFIILETLSSNNHKEEFTKSKVFFILNTENKSMLQIGRNTSCDVRIGDDISVSRTHSVIRKIGREYFIEDNNSTFGTLIQVQYPIFVSAELFGKQPLVLQSGKTQLQVNCRGPPEKSVNSCFRHFSCFSCCKKPQKRSNKGLVTFDKRQYFPLSFIEAIGPPTGTEREGKIDKKQIHKKAAHSKGPVVVQGLDEDDEAFNPNNEEEEPDLLGRDRAPDLNVGAAIGNNLLSRQNSQSHVRESVGPPHTGPLVSQGREVQHSEINLNLLSQQDVYPSGPQLPQLQSICPAQNLGTGSRIRESSAIQFRKTGLPFQRNAAAQELHPANADAGPDVGDEPFRRADDSLSHQEEPNGSANLIHRDRGRQGDGLQFAAQSQIIELPARRGADERSGADEFEQDFQSFEIDLDIDENVQPLKGNSSKQASQLPIKRMNEPNKSVINQAGQLLPSTIKPSLLLNPQDDPSAKAPIDKKHGLASAEGSIVNEQDRSIQVQRWPGKAASKVAGGTAGTPQKNTAAPDCFLSNEVKLPHGLLQRFNEEMQMSNLKHQSQAVSQNDLSGEIEQAAAQADRVAGASQVIPKSHGAAAAVENAQEDIVIRNVMRNKERRELKQIKEDESKNLLRSSQRMDSQPAAIDAHRGQRNEVGEHQNRHSRHSSERHERNSNRSSNKSNRKSEGRNSSRARKTGNRSRSRTSHKSEKLAGSRGASQSKLVHKSSESKDRRK